MSSKKTNHNPGLCPIEGQLSDTCSQVRARNLFLSLSLCTTRTTPVYVLHGHPFYLGSPDVLSLVGKLLLGDGVVHRITYSFSYFLFTYLFIYSFYSLYKRRAVIHLNN
jgi:hypothetical protein